jgi:hypothetical protein
MPAFSLSDENEWVAGNRRDLKIVHEKWITLNPIKVVLMANSKSSNLLPENNIGSSKILKYD